MKAMSPLSNHRLCHLEPLVLFLGSTRETPSKGTLLNPTFVSLLTGTFLRGSMSPRVPLILPPNDAPSISTSHPSEHERFPLMRR